MTRLQFINLAAANKLLHILRTGAIGAIIGIAVVDEVNTLAEFAYHTHLIPLVFGAGLIHFVKYFVWGKVTVHINKQVEAFTKEAEALNEGDPWPSNFKAPVK